MRILLAATNATRSVVLEEGLAASGYADVGVVRDLNFLMRRIADDAPDVIVIDLETPARSTLDDIFQIARCINRPIAVFVDRAGAETIAAAVNAGISAFVVDGLTQARVGPTLALACARHAATERLRAELEETKGALLERKFIERAKGLLMERGMSEANAYALMRRTAMNENRRIADVARSLLALGNTQEKAPPPLSLAGAAK